MALTNAALPARPIPGWCGHCLPLLLLGVWMLALTGSLSAQPSPPDTSSFLSAGHLAQVRDWARWPDATNRLVALSGRVAACFPEWSLLILHDETGNAGIKLDLSRFPFLQPGQLVAIQGPGQLGGGCVSLLPAKLVDNDGLHGVQSAHATVHLTPGMHPLEVRYFQFLREQLLNISYTRSSAQPQRLPDGMLYRLRDAGNPAMGFEPGLRYDYFEGIWDALPDFSQLVPVHSGVTSNLTLTPRQRENYYGLCFTGFLKITESGDYTFNLESDDGAQLFIGENTATVTTLSAPGTWQRTSPAKVEAGQPLSGNEDYLWATAEGIIKFIGFTGRSWQLEINSGGGLLNVYLGAQTSLPAGLTAGSRIRATGFCEAEWDARNHRVPSRLLVAAPQDLVVLTPPPLTRLADDNRNHPLPVLTSAEQVRALKPEEAARGYPVHLRGIITAHREITEGILQDDTSAIYARFHLPEGPPPAVGSFCEVTGTTEPGGFAPVVAVTQAIRLGSGQFPPPLHPDYEQLGSGSMDCLWVELQGMVASVEPEVRALHVAVKGGAVTAMFQVNGDLNFFTGLSNAFVRIRGCVIPGRNVAGQITKDVFLWVPASSCLAVDQSAAPDPFGAPLKMISELSRFDPNPNYYQTTRVRGQLLQVGGNQWYFTDGTNALRIIPKNPPPLTAGDLVEAVGLPELGTGSPLLREALIRKIGQAPLPVPVGLSLDQLSQPENDGRWARIEGRLVEIQTTPSGAVLWLQAGVINLPAVLPLNAPSSRLPPPGSRLSLCGVVAQRLGGEARNGGKGELELNSPADITCLQLPPFWTPRRTVVAMGTLAGILLLAGLWIYFLRRTVRLRTRSLRREMSERQSAEEKVRVFQTESALEEQRARIARNIHDDLGARVTKLNLLASQPPGSTADFPAHLASISATSRAMVEALDETVWAVNPVNDSLLRLADYVMHFAQDFFRHTTMRCQLDIPVDLPEQAVTAEFRFNVFLVVKEVLNNVLKHSQARSVVITMRVQSGELHLTIEDDGRGFDPASVPRRNGLSNLQNRVAGLGGKINLASRPGAGTRITVTVSLPATLQEPAP